MLAVNVINVLCLLLLLITLADCEVSVTSTPSKLVAGLTSSLDVRCSYKPSGGNNPSALVSLILSRSNNGTGFDDLASINVFLGNKVSIFATEPVTGTGAINSGGESFLNLHWDSPPESVAGIYKCSAQGPDNVGHNVMVDNTTNVQYTLPDQDVLLVKIQEMDTLLRLLQDRIVGMNDNWVTDYAILNSNITQVETCCYNNAMRLNSVVAQAMQTEINHRNLLLYLKPTLFFDSNSNSTYLMSKGEFNDVVSAENLCHAYNGYLAEINGEDEYNFIKNDLLRNLTGVFYTYVGVTNVNGQWLYRQSGRPVDYLNWAANEPKSGPENSCMFLESSLDWQMSAYKCASNNPIHALCEIR
ncbi:hypothetical protein Btru_000503 [Bulinus truncatus]|nr:hypothetical protein Btru_000503 [Bulinus truncatus]